MDFDTCRKTLARPAHLEAWPRLQVPLQTSNTGSSGTFLAQDETAVQWWVKPLNNLQNPKVVVTDYVIGKMGSLIGAAVCEVSVVVIPPELEGWEFRPGSHLAQGNAHGSRHVADATEYRDLRDRDRDDNRIRQTGLFALFDWCWGSDGQWLYQASNDNSIFSHDHGHYLPGGPGWTIDSLQTSVDLTHYSELKINELNLGELGRLVERLRAIKVEEIMDVLSEIPADWPVDNAELETLGWFLSQRSGTCSRRLAEIMTSLQ